MMRMKPMKTILYKVFPHRVNIESEIVEFNLWKPMATSYVPRLYANSKLCPNVSGTRPDTGCPPGAL